MKMKIKNNNQKLKEKKKKRNINIDLAILPSYDTIRKPHLRSIKFSDFPEEDQYKGVQVSSAY